MYAIQVEEDEIHLNLAGDPPRYGTDEILASRESDILGATSWYNDGFIVERIFSESEFIQIKAAVTSRVRAILESKGIHTPADFSLDQYHKYLGGSDDTHQSIIEVTRELRMDDIDFDFDLLVRRVSKAIGHPLKSVNDILRRSFLIVRINRPQSSDFNPPHKDGYLPLWQRTVNLWVPIAGVTANSSLPVVPKSHLLPESRIKRTASGALLNGKPYRVPAVVEWDGKRSMIRPAISEMDAMIFSPLLIHGCAMNMEHDVTRVALEIRLSSGVEATT